MYRSMNLKGFLLILGVMLLIFIVAHSALKGTLNEKTEEEKPAQEEPKDAPQEAAQPEAEAGQEAAPETPAE